MARISDISLRLTRAGVAAALAGVLAASPALASGGGLKPGPDGKQPTKIHTSTATTKASRTSRALVAPSAAAAAAACGGTSIAPGGSPAGGYLPLSLFGITPIAGVGDDTVTLFNVPSYTYHSVHYTQLVVSSNGYVQAGGTGTNSINNQNLPDPAEPNDTLAPFWTDLNPAAAGTVSIGTLTDGSDTWIVVDWAGVREFSSASNTHSFEVWIGVDSDANPGQDISYAYGSNTGNGDGGFLTVGAENESGSSGGNTYYNGAGTLPSNGTELSVGYSGEPTADFTATPTSGDAPLAVAFDASASSDDGSIVSYDWDFGDGATGTGATTNHTYAAGVWTAELTVTDNTGLTCSTTEEISVTGGFSVNNVSVNENAGTATFTVSRPNGPAASVDVSASAGSAKTPSDFTAAPTTLNFASGQTSQPYVVTINQDQRDEFTEHYRVNLSNPVNATITDGTGLGTIVDDDPPPSISVNDANIVEGDSGTRNLVFRVTLNRASGKTVKVTLHTADGSAVAPSDYYSKTVVLTFSPGQTLKSVPIAVRGDQVREPNETLFVLLNNPVNASILDPNGTGGIINDD
jgi:PKD repeat protein